MTQSRHPARVRPNTARDKDLKGAAPRRLIAPIACVLALLTGAWIGQAYTLLASSGPMDEIVPSSGSAEGTAWRFYDAIDLFFRVGDDGDVREILSSHFVDHVETFGAGTDRDGFLRYLARLRTSHPALRVVPHDVIAQHDRAVIRNALEGADSGTVMGIPLSGQAPWPEVEIVRIAHGQVVERWGGDVGYGSADLLVAKALTVSAPGEKVPHLRRVTFTPGGSDAALDRMAPAIVLVESGRLEADSADGDGFSTPKASRVLEPGSTLLITDPIDVRLHNRTDAPAVALLLSIGHPSGPTSSPVDGRFVASDSGVTEHELTSQGELWVASPGGRVTAELARITLSPGISIAPHAIEGVEMVVIEAGALAMTAGGASFTALLQDPIGRTVIPGPYAAMSQGHGLSISDRPDAEREGQTSYRNAGDQPVTFLFLRLRTG